MSENLGLLICVFEMYFLKKEGSIACPPPPSLYGSNFAYLKAYWKEFIKTFDEKAWVIKIKMFVEMILKMLQQTPVRYRRSWIFMSKGEYPMLCFLFKNVIFVVVNSCILNHVVIIFLMRILYLGGVYLLFFVFWV